MAKAPSEGYLKSLEEFNIDPDDVYEPLRIEPRRFIVLILKRDMWATWQTDPNFPVSADADKILARATIVQAIPVNYPRERDQLAFRRIVGSAIVQALSGDYAGAEATLTKAEAYVKARAGETSRLWYVQGCVFTVGVLVIIGAVTELPWGWGGGLWEHLGMAMAFGAIGAMFSFLSRLRSMEVDPASGWWAHYTDAAVRILLGGVGAFLFAVGIRANFVLGFTNAAGAGDNMWLLYVFAAGAGASERLVPDFLQQVESRGRQGQEEQADENGA